MVKPKDGLTDGTTLVRKDQTVGSGGSLWETLNTVLMVQVCSGGRTRSDGPWLDFGAKVGFGAQMANWRAQLARETCGRTHAVTCTTDSPNMWEQTGSFHPCVNQTKRLKCRNSYMCACLACAVRLVGYAMLCASDSSGTVRIDAGHVRKGRTCCWRICETHEGPQQLITTRDRKSVV